MSSDDPTRDLNDSENEVNTTQPTITAVFRLVRELKDGQEGLREGQESLREGQESLKTRLDAFEARVNSRFVEMSDEFKAALLELSDKLCDRIDHIRLNADSEYEVLLRRIRKLESKAS